MTTTLNDQTSQTIAPVGHRIEIYHEHIIPFIDAALTGDELLFVTPSSFFGYFSLGVRNFIEVCERLKDAKKRGVKVRVVVDVHDILTAKSTEGLLTFLTDGVELKHLEGNSDTYFLLVYRVSDKSRYVSFISDRPQTYAFLPGIQVRPYKKLRTIDNQMSAEDATSKKAEFDRLWEDSAVRVGPVINQYLPGYQFRRRMVALQTLSYLLTMGLGMVFGVSLMLQGMPSQFDFLSMLMFLLATAAVGLITGALGARLSDWFANKFMS